MTTMPFERVYRIDSESDVGRIIPQPIAYDPLPLKTAPSVSTLSSIAPSTAKKETTSLRPELAPPVTECELTEVPKHFFLHVLELHNSIEECFGEHLAFIRKQVRSDLDELERLNVKKTEELQKYAETVKDQDTWSFFGSVAKYFSYALSLVTGAALIATGVGAVAGYFLLAAGGLGLMSDKHIWETFTSYFTKSQEMQEKVARMVSGSLTCLSIGLGLIGGITACHSNGFRLLDRAMGTTKLIEKIGLAMGITTAGIKLRESWANKEMMAASAALKLTEGELFQLRKNLLQNSAESKKIIETMQMLTEQIKQAHSTFG